MIARATAEIAIQHGWTYVEVERITELADVVTIARHYGDSRHGVVLFCEDIDRLMRGDDRTAQIDQILNVIDGVESKGSALMIVLTTNELEKITTALLRPGRLDAIIHVGPPDAEAAEQLARQYGRGLIPDDEALTQSREAMAGKIPAVIREIVERSKLAAIRLTPEGEELRVTDSALLFAAEEMSEHVALLTPAEEDLRSETVKAADSMADAVRYAADKGLPVLPLHGAPLRPSGDAADVDGVYNDDATPGRRESKPRSTRRTAPVSAPAN
jgi:SpoVK/Ycf46/Vps4 family AAA+-type ATPase